MTKPNPCKRCGKTPDRIAIIGTLAQLVCTQCRKSVQVCSDTDAILGWNAMNPVDEPEKVVEEMCGNCLFFTGKVCRRFPPVGTHDGTANYTIWPSVTAGQWCGEWKSKL